MAKDHKGNVLPPAPAAAAAAASQAQATPAKALEQSPFADLLDAPTQQTGIVAGPPPAAPSLPQEEQMTLAAALERIAKLEALLAAQTPPAATAPDAPWASEQLLPFRVMVKDAPTRDVMAKDAANAFDAWKKATGAIASTNPPEVIALSSEQAAPMVA